MHIYFFLNLISCVKSSVTSVTVEPSHNVTATTITYTFEDTFDEDVDAEEYIVYVTTEADVTLLNDSVTWAMVQSATPPYGYVALRCADLFVNGGCSDNSKRRKRQTLDRVVLEIGKLYF